MELEAKLHEIKKPIMVLGTSSGAGKSLTVTAICRILKNLGEEPIPFKGQNMSNNAWVDWEGGEMAYSQALQAFACGINPSAEMNPILLKPQGNSISEVIHLGKSIGTTTAQNYYKDWFIPGWEVIKKSLKSIYEGNPNCRLIIEGAGSPVEMNLIHRDLTNLRVAKYLNANCILVTDIERGGVFAQIIGTLELMKPEEKNLIKGIIINRFRGDLSLFEDGKKWIENKTQIPVIGIIPWLNDSFPPEDSLDLIEKKSLSKNPEIKVGIIKLPSISNFSDFDPLENEETIFIEWIRKSQNLSKYDFIILPGSKQTSEQKIKGIGLLPLKTTFFKKKLTRQINSKSIWPCQSEINGFEIHNGQTVLDDIQSSLKINPIFKDLDLGWYKENNKGGTIAGTYIHGIFENDSWRAQYINLIRKSKNLPILNKKSISYKEKRQSIIDNLANEFHKHLNLKSFLS